VSLLIQLTGRSDEFKAILKNRFLNMTFVDLNNSSGRARSVFQANLLQI